MVSFQRLFVPRRLQKVCQGLYIAQSSASGHNPKETAKRRLSQSHAMGGVMLELRWIRKDSNVSISVILASSRGEPIAGKSEQPL